MSKIESFEMEITTLGRSRKVWVYLPENYSESADGFPVIYMHDGQNLFYDELTAYGAAWHVNEVLDDIYAKTGKSCIVVGVECLGERRLSEYSPWKIHPLAFKEKLTIATKGNRGGEGGKYSEWLVKVLKPYIDERYNTDKERSATAIAGSSMGGLISCYLGLRYQRVFETMGLFSTYTEFNQPAFNRFVRKTHQSEQQHSYIYCGGKEWNDSTSNRRMLRNSIRLYNMLTKRNVACELVLDSEQHHYETAWEIHFYKFAQDFLERYSANRGGE